MFREIVNLLSLCVADSSSLCTNQILTQPWEILLGGELLHSLIILTKVIVVAS